MMGISIMARTKIADHQSSSIKSCRRRFVNSLIGSAQRTTNWYLPPRQRAEGGDFAKEGEGNEDCVKRSR